MKKSLIIFIILIFSFNINLNAECSDKKLINEAKAVTVLSEPKITEDGYRYFLITVKNVKDNMVVLMIEDDGTEYRYAYADTNKGTIELENEFIFLESTYDIEIYSIDEKCQNMLLETKKASTIKFNDYSKYEVCENNKEFELCQPFYEGEKVSEEVFNNAINEYIKEKEKTVWEKSLDIVKEYYPYVLIPFVLITSGYYISLNVNRRKK